MPTSAVAPVPPELAHRLRPWERVLWWGRPRRIVATGRDPAWLPILAILAGTALIMAFVPQPSWHPVVATIFRLAFAFSALSLLATHLTIVVRQRRQTIYAVTQDRAMIVAGFWGGGFRAFPLERLADLRLQVRPDGEGTIWFGGRAHFRHVADARSVYAVLVAAAQARSGWGLDSP